MTREDGKKGKNNTHHPTHAQTRQPRPGALRSNLLRIDDALFPSSSLSLSLTFLTKRHGSSVRVTLPQSERMSVFFPHSAFLIFAFAASWPSMHYWFSCWRYLVFFLAGCIRKVFLAVRFAGSLACFCWLTTLMILLSLLLFVTTAGQAGNVLSSFEGCHSLHEPLF